MNLRLEGDAAVNVLTEARNAVRIDIANFLNLNASALDGAKPQASLTYETQQTESQELQDRMAFWTAPLSTGSRRMTQCPPVSACASTSHRAPRRRPAHPRRTDGHHTHLGRLDHRDSREH